MFAKLELKLGGESEISYQMASVFHGALMELLPEDYGAQLHESRLHPYTQHLERRQDGWYWIVTALEDRAAATILQKSLFPLEELYIRQHDARFKIEKRITLSCRIRNWPGPFMKGKTAGIFPFVF